MCCKRASDRPRDEGTLLCYGQGFVGVRSQRTFVILNLLIGLGIPALTPIKAVRPGLPLARRVWKPDADETEKWRKLIPSTNVKAQDPRGPTWREMHRQLEGSVNSRITSTTLVSEAVRVLAYRALTCQEADRRRTLP